MSVPRLTAVPERANDTGVRCALRRFRSAHRDRRVSAAATTSCAHAACPARAARAAQAVTLASQQSVPEGCRAPLPGGGGPVGRPAGRRAVRHRRSRPGRAGPARRLAFPHGIGGPGATPGEVGMEVHIPTLAVPYEACRIGGSSRPRPRSADRHRRSDGRGATLSRYATCGIGAMHVRNAFSCTSTLMSHVHLWIGIGDVENRLQVTAFRPEIMKLRIGR